MFYAELAGQRTDLHRFTWGGIAATKREFTAETQRTLSFKFFPGGADGPFAS
jgi:hypothetical protein